MAPPAQKEGATSRPRSDPPAAESPVWLPSLAHPRGPGGVASPTGRSGTSGLMPKTKSLASPNTLRGSADPSALFSISTLPQYDALELPGMRKKKHTSAVPKLPSIEKSGTGSPRGTGLTGLPSLRSNGASPAAVAHAQRSGGRDDGAASSPSERGASEDDDELVSAPGHPVDDGSYDPDMIPGIETGEDVIAFYAKYGQDSAVKFFYCNRAHGGVRFRPYDLVVVQRQKVDAEYFTVSATGMMRIRHGVQSEFTSLAEWVREKTMFDLISSIKFFKHYLTGRCFRRWHKRVRQKNFNHVRQTIQDNLFLAKPTFLLHLQAIAAAADKVRSIHFMSANPNHLYSLQEFSDLQMVTREQKARPALEGVVDEVQKVLEAVCLEVNKQAKLYQESVRDQTELQDTTGVELTQGKSGGCARPMIRIKQEKIERAENYQRVMRELTMLGAFVRVADYMFVEGVIDRAITSTQELLALLTAPKLAADKASKGTFLTTIAFTPDAISFMPDEAAVLDDLNSSVESIISIAQQAPRLVFMRTFAQYFQGKPSGLNPPAIIRNSPLFQQLRQSITETIGEDFDESAEYVKIFEEYRKVYNFGRTWDFNEYSKEAKSLREIRRDLHRQREWRNELERMKISNVVGCLYIDSKSLRNDLMPTTTATLDKVKLLLLTKSRETCLEVLEDIQGRVALLQGRPSELHDYMAYVKSHSQQVEEKREVVGRAATVDDMYDMLAAYEQKVPTSDQVKHDDLREAAALFTAELANGKAYTADLKAQQQETLKSNVAQMYEELAAIHASMSQGDYVDPDADPEQMVEELEQALAHVTELGAVCQTYQDYQRMFELDVDDFGAHTLCEKEVTARCALWKGMCEFLEKSNAWTEDAILTESGEVQLNIETIRAEVDDYATRAYKMGKTYKDDPVVMRFKDSIDDFKQILPLVEELANPALATRHWREIFELIDADIPVSEDGTGFEAFNVRALLQYNILDKMDTIQTVSSVASKEYSLQKVLEKMRADWSGVVFRIMEYKDTGTYIMGGTDEVQALLDDQIVKTQSMRASPYIKALEKDACAWEELMVRLQDIVDNWLACQSTWQYLEPIFSSPDIMKQMPEEGEKFQVVDQGWRDVMDQAAAAPGCLSIGSSKEMLVTLEENNRLLDEIQKGLAAYLEVKRIAFPRFFFLSNDEMLEILSETKDPTRVQPHLKKCFEGIDKLRFEGERCEITGMQSVEGELIPLKTKIKPADANGSVEKWLVQVEAGMCESLQEVSKNGVQSYANTPRTQWVLEWPGQIVLVVTAVYWTRAVGDAIVSTARGALQACADANTAQLTDVVNLVRGDLSKLNRSTLSALVVMDVHARDVTQQLAVEGIEGQPNHFSWLSQLRMYWEDVHDDPNKLSAMVRMMNASVEYGYEYLGNSMRLVVTPLTDRCYRTLMGAIHLNMGGAPEGPAGTGKTETTKDLAKALARQCVVFNCSDTLDYLTMAKFFKGLASSGAWACFDEFNRIDLEVLSVVAQQVLEVQLAVKNKVKTFVFEGSELPLRPTCNAFITMNPGYAGRSELPDNLKALFRTVAMMVPDYALISEIMLYSSGYLQARDLARKLVATYKLCSEQLSSQSHYDYGMRAVISVLRAAAANKQKYGDAVEDVLMLRSIKDVNAPKFLAPDVPLFEGILSDLFPGVDLPAADYTALDKGLLDNCERLKLQPTDMFIEKAHQLYEMILVRHGLMLVGYSYGAKTATYQALAGALGDLEAAGLMDEHKVQVKVMNPKSIYMGQLYGQFDPVSHEWKDGVLAQVFRSCAVDTSPDRKWVLFDGPVDAVWIENMNTVLDDNKKLCLNSGEIIQMSATMNMIFEVQDLAVASPATVSRCGMVYVEPSQIGWRPLQASWMAAALPGALPEDGAARVNALFGWLVDPCVAFLRRNCRELAPTADIGLVVSLMQLSESLLREGFAAKGGVAEKDVPKLIDGVFVFSLIWSVGGTTDNEGRALFSGFLRKLLDQSVDKSPNRKDYDLGAGLVVAYPDFKLSVALPKEGGVHDYMFDLAKAQWQHWMDTVKVEPLHESLPFNEIVVQTVDTVRYAYLMQLLVAHRKHLLFVGPTGTGKTVYVKAGLDALDKGMYTSIETAFSAQTSANQVQDIIDAKLDKRRKGVYGPPVGKRCVVFVDDLNMPALEVYGAQPPIELLRQWMDHGGWYDRSDNTVRRLEDIQFVAAMGPPGGGRNPVTPRFVRHFNVVAITEFDDETYARIYGAIGDWWFRRAKLPEEVRAKGPALVKATVEIYNTIRAELLPTPAKSHYTYNMRDLSKVFQGMQMVGTPVDDTKKLARLWAHETLRVLHDRLVSDDDRLWYQTLLKAMVDKHLGLKFDNVFEPPEGSGLHKGDVSVLRTVLYCDFMTQGADNQKYEEVSDVSKLLSTIEEYLTDYNAQSKSRMDLVLFLYAAEHVCRVSRIIKQPYGNALLVGVGGSGRQSLAKVATFMAEFSLFSIEISKSYTAAEWREDLCKVLRQAGAKFQPTVFLFSDTQLKEESFLEDINNILNTGEVPSLFPKDELVTIMEAVTPRAKRAGKPLTPQGLYQFFVDSCRQNLHMVLCMSPVGSAFRERLRKFPSLVNCTTIDWFSEWPSDALKSVASRFLKDVEFDSAATRGAVEDMCMVFHQSVRVLAADFMRELQRPYYVTPTSYLELIQTYKDLLGSRRTAVNLTKRRYVVGLEKLLAAESDVNVMKQELIELQPKLIETGKEVAETLVVVARETAEAEAKKEVVMGEEAVANEKAAAAKAIKDECEGELAVAMPLLEAALSALNTLSKNDITEVKAMKSPPAAVKLVMEAVCHMLGVKPARVNDPNKPGAKMNDFWGPSQALLGQANFLEQLQTFDKDNIPAATVAIIKPYVEKPEFEPDLVKKASKAAYGLCCWVRAMEAYDRVAKVVAPKKAKLAEAEAEFSELMVGLNAKKAELKEVEDRLAVLNAKLADMQARKQQLEYDVDLCEKKLNRATQLIGGLGGEKTRWTEVAARLGEDYVNLTGDVLLASGFIAYLGAFTSQYRERSAAEWVQLCRKQSIPCADAFSLVKILGDPVKIRDWTIDGLPNDSFSIDNGIMMSKARRWPLLIDPQAQANKWVKRMERKSKLEVLKLSDGDYMRRLENCIQFGFPVLLENVGEELDPTLEPLLLKSVFKQGGSLAIRLGDATIEYSENFRFYITTKLRNPHYLPEVSVKVTLINFMITLDGLEDQLLGIVVSRERPELEEEKTKLVLQGAENARQLKEIEDKIIQVLSASEGNILEDETAINVISSSKTLSNDIAQKQVVAEKTERKIDEARMGYQPVARHVSVLFFVISDLATVEPMYQYSLAWFVKLFDDTISRSERSRDVASRIAALVSHFTYALYVAVCRSLFEKDKLLFSFALATGLMQRIRGTLSPAQLRFLLTGGVAAGEPPQNPTAWLPDRQWAEAVRLSYAFPESFAELPVSLSGDPAPWRAIYECADPAAAALPGEWDASLSGFERLLAMRVLRPDKLIARMQMFVEAELGRKFVEPPPFDLDRCYQDSSALTPLIFVLSPGVDPMAALLKFAESLRASVESISLGQGQGPKAAALIEAARRDGGWVVLQNCHLATSWMPTLERICEGLGPETTSPHFRLWLTSYPSPHFPVAVLQNGIKMTNDPPNGLRANLLGSYLSDPVNDPSFFNGCERPAEFKKLLFGLCFFHAFVQERLKFGPLGWNVPYQFSQPDFAISVRQLQMFLNEFPGILPLRALTYLTGECNYGGRVTDAHDRRTLMSILDVFYCEAAVLDDSYRYSPSGLYYAPPDGTYNDYVSHVRSLPVCAEPEVFGLHANADITKDQQETDATLAALLAMQGSATSSGGRGRDEVLAELAADIQHRVPAPFDIEAARYKYPVDYYESMNTVLCQELVRFNRLLAVVHETLKALQKALKGLVLMSDDLEKLGTAMFDGKVPAMWMAKSYPSQKPLGSYVTDLVARCVMMSSWIEHGPPRSFWLAGFYFTHAFLTGVKQNFARKHRVPIDTVTFSFECLPRDGEHSAAGGGDGAVVTGMHVEGARWCGDANALVESLPKVLFSPAPAMRLVPCEQSKRTEFPHYECPLYRTPERRGVLATTGHSTNFVMELMIPSDQPQDHWVRRGVAFLLSLAD